MVRKDVDKLLDNAFIAEETIIRYICLMVITCLATISNDQLTITTLAIYFLPMNFDHKCLVANYLHLL